jgi:hypothetical protein
MEHVVVRWERGGYWLDATAYEAILPSLATSLPPGASAFALDPQHYDFSSDRCVHDLWFRSLTLDDSGGSAALSFGAGEVNLSLVYSGLVRVAIDRDRDPGIGWLGQLLLDELRPSPEGCVHEFAMTGGSLLVVARDVDATWS